MIYLSIIIFILAVLCFIGFYSVFIRYYPMFEQFYGKWKAMETLKYTIIILIVDILIMLGIIYYWIF